MPCSAVQPLRREIILDFLRIYEILALRFGRPSKHLSEDPVKQLIAFFLEHAMLDFSGDLSLEMVRDFLREDDSREARALLAKLMKEGGVEDMIVTLADCLQEYLRTGLNDDVVRDQLRLYSES